MLANIHIATADQGFLKGEIIERLARSEFVNLDAEDHVYGYVLINRGSREITETDKLLVDGAARGVFGDAYSITRVVEVKGRDLFKFGADIIGAGHIHNFVIAFVC
jgi:hypothetical protein